MVSKDITPFFAFLRNLQITNNSSFLFDKNYGIFHSARQPENDINYLNLSWYNYELQIKMHE